MVAKVIHTGKNIIILGVGDEIGGIPTPINAEVCAEDTVCSSVVD